MQRITRDDYNIDYDYNSDDYKLANVVSPKTQTEFFKVVIKGNTEPFEIIDHYLMNNHVNIDECSGLIISEKSHIKINEEIFNYYKLPVEKITFMYDKYECITYQNVNGNSAVRDMFDSFNMSYDLVLLIKKGNLEVVKKIHRDAVKWYNSKILNKDKVKDKITCYNWNDWRWEALVKQNKREERTLYYDDKFIKEVIDDIEDFLSEEHKAIYTRLGITYKKCYLFEGPPGTGKSSMIYGIASKFELDIAYLNIHDELKSNSLTESIRKIPKKTLLVIEDIDAIFDKREKKDLCQKVTFSGLLNAIDGVVKPSDGCIIIFTTNYKDKLDEALKRPGRVDKIVSFDYASREQIQKMFNNYFPDEKANFERFYKKIKSMKKMTICYLQQYFLKYIKSTENMYDNIDELKKIIEECDMFKDPPNLYN